MTAAAGARDTWASPEKSQRGRPRDETIRRALAVLVGAEAPCTVRQTYYQATVHGLVPKTEAGYDKVGRLLSEMRREGVVPWGHIADNTRWMRKPATYSSAEAALTRWTASYRRDLLDVKGANIEVWLEKDALAGVVYEVTARWDVPLMVTRGYASLSFLHEAAMTLSLWARRGVPTRIYYFGDHDPSGRDIDRKVEEELRNFAPDAELHFERIAVTEEQIAGWMLPSRPTKARDSRSHTFVGDSVELDAIPAARLRELVDDTIRTHIDPTILAQSLAIEASERQTLRLLTNQMADAR